MEIGKEMRDSELSYGPGEFFMMRVPLFPLERLWLQPSEPSGRTCEQPSATNVDFENSCRTARWGIEQLTQDGRFMDAVAIASPNLVRAVCRTAGDGFAQGKRGRVLAALYRYHVRATSRCTPFGGFAAVALGNIHARTRSCLSTPHPSSWVAMVRADAHVAMSTASAIAHVGANKPGRRYLVNSTAYSVGDHVRYYAAPRGAYSDGAELVAIGRSQEVRALLECAGRSLPMSEILKIVGADAPDATTTEIAAFVRELVDAQLLVPDVYPAPTGCELMAGLKEKLRGIGEYSDWACLVQGIQNMVDVVRSSRVGEMHSNIENEWREVCAIAGRMGAEYALPQALMECWSDNAMPVQVDSVNPAAELVLDLSVVTPILVTVEAMLRLGFVDRGAALSEFAAEYARRFGERELPLAMALDPDSGIPFGNAGRLMAEPSPLLKISANAKTDGANGGWSDSLPNWISRKLYRAIETHAEEIVLNSDEIFRRSSPVARNLAPSTCVMFSLLAPVEECEAGSGDLLYMCCHGASALSMFGRFANSFGEALEEKLRGTAGYEEGCADADICEVSYLPTGHLGNVCQRPHLRKSEIVYNAPISESGSTVLRRAGELRVSVRAGRVRLRCAVSGKAILPRIDSAINSQHMAHLPMFAFLGALQEQDACVAQQWRWRQHSSAPELPRVKIDNVVVSPRLWNFDDRELRMIGKLKFGADKATLDYQSHVRLQSWIRARGLPSRLVLGSLSDYLVIDFDSPFGESLFAKEVFRYGAARELIEDRRTSALSGGGYGCVHEIVMPIRKRKISRSDVRGGVATGSASATAEGALGIRHGVVYASIYAGPAALDRFLRERVFDFAAHLTVSETAMQWHFVRYRELGDHLRIRFFVGKSDVAMAVMCEIEQLCSCLGNDGSVRLTFNQYEPEVIRYGGVEGLRICERIFHIDSTHVLRMLSAFDEAAGNGAFEGIGNSVDGRWLLALLSCQELLGDFGLTRAEIETFLVKYAAAYASEMGFAVSEFRAIGQLYRSHQEVIEMVCGIAAVERDSRMAPVIAILRARRKLMESAIAELRQAEFERSLGVRIESIFQSLLHMHCNRMFISAPRRQEAVLLHLLLRLTRAKLARR